MVAIKFWAHAGLVTQGDVSVIGAQGKCQGNRIVEIRVEVM